MEKISSKKKYNFYSNKNEEIEIIIQIQSISEIKILAYNTKKQKKFEKYFTLEFLINKFKYLSILDTVEEIFNEITNKIELYQPILIEEKDSLKIGIKTGHTKFKKIVLNLEKEEELYKFEKNEERNNINKLYKHMNEIGDEISYKNKSKDEFKNPFENNFKNIKENNKRWITYLSKLKDGRLISCLTNGKVKIYSKEDFKVKLIIEEDSSEVNSVTELNDGRIIICYDSHIMKVIKLVNNSYNVEQILKGHTDYVYKMIEVKQNIFVSISKDKTMRIWELNANGIFNYVKSIVYQNNNSSSNILKISDDKFVTTCWGKEENVKFWNINDFKLIKTIYIRPNWPRKNMCLLDDDTLCIGGHNSGFYLIKISTYEYVNYFPNINIFSIIKCQDGTIICGIEDENKNNLLIKYKFGGIFPVKVCEKESAHYSHILTLVELKNGTIASGGKDGIIKLWKNIE